MFLRFVVVGGIGFVIDAGLTHLLIALGLGAVLARPPAMLAALVFTWLANRHFTFQTQQRRSAAELLRYGLVAGAAFALNFGLYTLAITRGGLPPLAAIVLATGAQVGFSFFGYRYFVFRAG